MWGHRLTSPYHFEAEVLPAPAPGDLGPGQVLVRLLVAGICGSDLTFFRGSLFPFATLENGRYRNPPGAPLHELVGEVLASRDETLPVGARVVGWASGNNALTELVVADGEGLVEYDPEWPPEQAIMLQPLACVMHALHQVAAIGDGRAAVIGQGSIGVLFSHALKSMGARHVTGIDKVNRLDLAGQFGVDLMVHASSEQWAAEVLADPSSERPGLVVEAAGHQIGTLRDAVEVLAMGGQLYYFGIPDDQIYPFPLYQFLRKNARLAAGTTPSGQRRPALVKAQEHIRAHPEIVPGYVTHVFGVEEVNQAFQLALTPAPGQLKVVLRAAR
jgi:L-iditol 2-dehydrogenase